MPVCPIPFESKTTLDVYCTAMKRSSTSELSPAGAQTGIQAGPTRARYWVIVFAITLAVLSYIDRVAISQAARPISQDLHLTKSQMGLIFGAFGISYALFEIPSGWLGDA